MQSTIFADTESGPAVWIRVEGKGTFENSPGLKAFSAQMMDGGRNKIVVDLKNCPAMDSTFMGTLAGIAVRLRDCPGGSLWVLNRNERNSDLLEGLGLHTLFAESTPPESVSASAEAGAAVPQGADKTATREAMIEAHETCVQVNPANAAKFKDVLEYLKGSVRKDAGSKA
jgi:anti-sigma B factor antagonist